jgi:hypothetical protein
LNQNFLLRFDFQKYEVFKYRTLVTIVSYVIAYSDIGGAWFLGRAQAFIELAAALRMAAEDAEAKILTFSVS